ncbi:MAG: type II toxin-antitoxin system VapC family toxin [Xanthobacteraceae bacterium]
MHCLDTNVVIGLLKGGSPRLLARFEIELAREAIALPAIVLFELEYGVAKSERRRENDERLEVFRRAPIPVLPFDAEDAREAGDIRAALAKVGKPIGPYDVLIAAQARRRGATLVTANRREFVRVPGLKTENWAA